MMKPILLLLGGTLLFASCQKKDSEQGPESPGQNTKIDPANANAVAAAIKIWHGVSQNGNPPVVSSANGPVLDEFSNNREIQAFSGKFAVFQPKVASGNIAGYYFQVKGSGSHFKIDFSRPRNAGRFRQSRAVSLRRSLRLSNDPAGGYADSAIVITVPSNLQPGSFCGIYWAFDASGNIGNPITICFTITKPGTDAASSFLLGTWHETAWKSNSDINWIPSTAPDTMAIFYGYCDGNNKISLGCSGQNCELKRFPEGLYIMLNNSHTYLSNGNLDISREYEVRETLINSSSCDKLVFNTYKESGSGTCTWSYNSSTKKLLQITEFDDDGNPDLDIWEYEVTKISDKKILLQERFEKFWVQLEK